MSERKYEIHKTKKKKGRNKNSTIFDDVFKTMTAKFPWLLIPLINEAFDTNYDESELIDREKTEYATPKGKRTMDSHIKIRDKIYHVECQSTEDCFMIIRMIEYDFHEALDKTREDMVNKLKNTGVKDKEERIKLNFPNSCVLYLRHSDNTPDCLDMDINIPDNDTVLYKVPIVKVQNYTKDVIFQKRLLMLLPFYILKYEKAIKSGKTDFIEEWAQEYTDILKRIRNDNKNNICGVYEQLIELIKKLSEYVGVENERFMERVGEVMGGQILELETGKAWEQGLQQGRIEKEYQEIRFIMNMDKNGYTLEQIALVADRTVEEVQQIIDKNKNLI